MIYMYLSSSSVTSFLSRLDALFLANGNDDEIAKDNRDSLEERVYF